MADSSQSEVTSEAGHLYALGEMKPVVTSPDIPSPLDDCEVTEEASLTSTGFSSPLCSMLVVGLVLGALI